MKEKKLTYEQLQKENELLKNKLLELESLSPISKTFNKACNLNTTISVLNELKIALLIYDESTEGIIFKNHELEVLLGEQAEEYIKLAPIKELIQNFGNKKYAQLNHTPVFEKGTDTIFCDLTASKLNLEDKEYYLIFFKNSNELSERAQSLNKSIEMLNQLIDSSSIGVLICESGNIIHSNSIIEELFHKPGKEIIGSSFDSFLTEEGKGYISVLMDKRRSGNTESFKFQSELKVRKKDVKPIEIVSSRFLYQGKETELVFVKDISSFSQQFAEEIKEAEDTKLAILNTFPDLFFRLNKEGNFLDYHSNNTEDLYANPSLFLGKNIIDVLPPEVAHLTQIHLEKVSKTKEVSSFEYQLTKAGELFYYEARIGQISDSDEFVVIVRDITNKAKLEKEVLEKEKLFQLIGNYSNDVIWIYNLSQDKFIYYSPSVYELRGYTPEEASSQSMADILAPETLKFVQAELPKRIESFLNNVEKNSFYIDEFRQFHKNGNIVDTEVNTSFFINSDQSICVLGITRNISSRKKLAKKEHYQKDILEYIVLGKPINETLEKIIDCVSLELPKAKISILGISEKEECFHYLAGKNFSDDFKNAIHGLKYGINIGTCGVVAVNKKMHISENLLTDPNWQPFLHYVHSEKIGSCFSLPILSHDQSILGTFAIYHEQSFVPSDSNLEYIEAFVSLASIALQRFIGETNLRESEIKFASAFNASPDSFSITTLDEGRFIDVNEAFQKEFLYSKDEVIGKTSLDLGIWVNKSDRDFYKNQLEKFGIIRDFETILKNKKNKNIICLVSSQVVSNKNGVRWVVNSTKNITKAKLEQEEKERLILKEKESSGRIIDILETISDGFVSINKNWEFSYINRKASELLQRSAASLLNKVLWDEFKMDENSSIRMAMKEAMDSFKTSEVSDYESSINKWLESKIYPSPDGINLFFRDISVQKEAEIKLKESELKFRNLFESTPDGIIYYDENGQIELMNPSAMDILQINHPKPDTTSPEDISFIVLDQDGKEINYLNTSIFNALKTGQVYINDIYGLKRKNRDEVLWLRSNVVPFKDANGLTKVFTSFANITEQKLAEEALINSRNELRRANQIAKLGNFKLDLKKLIFTGSEQAYEIMGYKYGEEISISNLLKKLHRQDYAKFGFFWSESLNSKNFNFEHRVIVNGQIRWLSIWAESSYSNKERSVEVLGIMMDITERKNAELLAKNEKERLQTLIQTIPDLVWLKNPEGKFILCNPQFSRLYNKEPHELIGLTDYDLLDKETAAEYEKFDQVALASKGPVKTIGKIQLKGYSGDLVVETFKTKLLDVDGNLVGILGVGRDLTEITKATNALVENERKLKEAQHFAKMGNWELDIRRSELFWSDEVYEIFEVDRNSFDNTYDGFLNLIHPEDRDVVDHFYIESLKSKMPYDITHRLLMPSGNMKYVHERCITIFNEKGEAVRSLGTIQDITEIHTTQLELQDREQILSSILDTVGNGIFLINIDENHDFRFKSVNAMMARYIGTKEENIIGKKFMDVLGKSDNGFLVIEKMEEAILKKKSVSWEVNGNRGAEKFAGDVNIVPVFDTSGKCVYIVGAIHDITSRKTAEEELSLLNQMLEQRVLERTEQLEAANKELESFAYSVSHDLRAPLRHIDGFTNLLKSSLADKLNEDSLKYFHKIEDAGLRMSNMIDSLLKFSRLGRQSLQLTHVHLNVLFEQIIKNIEPDLQGRSVKFEISDFPNIIADKQLLELAFINLISNAIKFTAKKEEAKIEIGKFEAGSDEIGIFIKDNGAGFDMAYADKLFGVFQRLHTQNDFAGTGIGLASVLQIVKKHNGNIWAEGKENEGATFFVKLKTNLNS